MWQTSSGIKEDNFDFVSKFDMLKSWSPSSLFTTPNGKRGGGDQDMFQMPGKYHIENETCPPYRTIDMIAAIFAIISTIGADGLR